MKGAVYTLHPLQVKCILGYIKMKLHYEQIWHVNVYHAQ